MKIVLFGPPGSGKTTVGRMFSEHLSLAFYDAHQEIKLQDRPLISQNLWTDQNRLDFLGRVVTRIHQYEDNGQTDLVIAIALTKQWMRDFLSSHVEDLRMVLVKSSLSPSQQEAMIVRRHKEGHPISLESFKRFNSEFDPPQGAYWEIVNTFDRSVTDSFESLYQALKHD